MFVTPTKRLPRLQVWGRRYYSERQQGREWFPMVKGIEYEGPSSRNPLAFKHYNSDEVVLGKTMKEHLRFSVAWWHTFRGDGRDPFGAPTLLRPWNDDSNTINEALNRVDAAFEFFHKLGVGYYTFHDVDVSPQVEDLKASNEMLDEVTDYMKTKQEELDINLLWGTANLFSHPRYMLGAATSSDFNVYARAAAQVKHCMEVTHKLGGKNYVFWGGKGN